MLVVKKAENSQKSIAYIRVSSQRQVDEGVSMEAQKRRIREYARFKGLSLADEDIIVEEGVSGGIPLWDRPRGRVLKQRLSTGKYNNLISMKLDRMFRVTTDMLTTIDELADAGISIHIVDMEGEALDTSTSIGRFFLTIMGAMAEMERGLISERTQEGMNQLKATHQKFTQSVYGWDVGISSGEEPEQAGHQGQARGAVAWGECSENRQERIPQAEGQVPQAEELGNEALAPIRESSISLNNITSVWTHCPRG